MSFIMLSLTAGGKKQAADQTQRWIKCLKGYLFAPAVLAALIKEAASLQT